MSVLFIALPVALALAGLAVAAFVCSVRRGQFDDLETPPLRILFDGSDTRAPESRAR
jgi:cbb3-type cytochrome oxidase maturation protein